MMIFGTRCFGQVNNTEYSFVTTSFFHINFVPLIPTSCVLVTAEGEYKLPSYHWPAVLHGYSKLLLTAMVLTPTLYSLYAAIYHGDMLTSSTPVMVVVMLTLMALGILAFYGLNTTYNELFKGAHPFEEHVF